MKVRLNACSVCGLGAFLLSDRKGFYATRCSNNDCENSAYKTYDSEEAAVADWNRDNPERKE